MSAILGAVKDLFAGVKYKKIHIDNVAFRLHYKVTGIICLVFGIIIAERQYIGDPIDCITDSKADKIIDQFCWVHGTYTQLKISPTNQIGYDKVPTSEDDVEYLKAFQRASNTRHSEKGGLREEFSGYFDGDPNHREFHTYYQWIWWFLFLEVLIFYFPHWLWKTWEGGRMKTFVADLNAFVLSDAEKHKYQDAVCDYFCNQQKGQWSILCWAPKGNHTIYALKYFFCELLNFANIVLQLYYLDAFFKNSFSKYGLKLWRMSDSRPYARDDYLTKIFPIITMCEIPIYGFAGAITNHQALCVLPINIINEKVFIFLWHWFIFLMFITALSICYRLVTLFPCIRVRKWLMLRLNHSMPERTVDTVCRAVDFGDWFFLYLMGKNMNPVYYAELIENLSSRFEANAPDSPSSIEPWSSEFRKGSFIGV